MKGNFTSHQSLLQVTNKGVLALLVALFCCSTAFSQTGTAIDLGYLSSVTWKATPELNNAIVQKQSEITLALTVPNMPLDEKATFKAFERLLNYVQSNLQAGKPASEAITLSYDQVLAEAPKDPVLAYMPDGMLETFVPGLVESLTATPVPGN